MQAIKAKSNSKYELFWKIPLLQIAHTNGLIPLCRFLCSFRVSIRVNFFPHKSQINLELEIKI